MSEGRSERWTRWMVQARDGDREAFDRLLGEARPAIRSRAVGRLQDEALAEEVATQTFVRAWKHRASYDAARANAATWLYRIADRLVTDQGRARQRQRDRELTGFDSLAVGGDGEGVVRVEPEDDVEVPAAEGDHGRAAMLLAQGMNELSEADQTILRLFYYEELSYGEIAERMEIGAKAVGPRLTRARQRLLEKLPPEVVL